MKSSELLQEVYNKLVNLEKLFKLSDYKQTLIIKKINEMNFNEQKSTNNNLIDLVKPKGPGKVVTPDLMPDALELELKTKKNKLMSISKSKDVDKHYDNEDLTDNENSPKFPVTQKLTGSNGKALTQTEIVVKNMNGGMIKRIKSNSSGRWQIMLSVGKYIVEVSGKDMKETISYTQSFEVKQSTTPILLPMPEMYKRYDE